MPAARGMIRPGGPERGEMAQGAGGNAAVIQRAGGLYGAAGESVAGTDIDFLIIGDFLNNRDRRMAELVSKRSKQQVERVRQWYAQHRRYDIEGTLRLSPPEHRQTNAMSLLQQAIVRRFHKEELAHKSGRNRIIKITAKKIVESIWKWSKNEERAIYLVQQLLMTTRQWGPMAAGKDDGLLAALGKLAAAKHEGVIKGAIGEIQDASFFAEKYRAPITMDETMRYEKLIGGQYRDTDPEKQVDILFEDEGTTHLVETKFDAETAHGAHGELPMSKILKQRATSIRMAFPHLKEEEPVTIPYLTDDPRGQLPTLYNQQLLGYEAAGKALEEKGVHVRRIVSIPNPRDWLRLFTGVPSAVGAYILGGWHLRIGSIIMDPEMMTAVQAKVMNEALGTPNPSYRQKLDGKEALRAYAARHAGTMIEEYLKTL
jgi:hypothetical protein